MSQQQLLKRVVSALEDAGVEYMLTGSLVSSLQGEPRSTHDIDLVVALTQEGARAIIRAFPQPEFYLNEESVLDALRQKHMFNLIHGAEGDKVDFWILTDDPFDHSRFSRRASVKAFGLQLHVSTPEDTILAKLSWAKESGGSEKHFRDALRVYEIHRKFLDLKYVTEWSSNLSVSEYWEKIQREAEQE